MRTFGTTSAKSSKVTRPASFPLISTSKYTIGFAIDIELREKARIGASFRRDGRNAAQEVNMATRKAANKYGRKKNKM